MSSSRTITELINFLRGKENIPSYIRLLILSDHEYLIIKNGNYFFGASAEQFGFVSDIEPERGTILGAFSILEVLVNELIILKIVGPFNDQGNKLGDLLENIDFFHIYVVKLGALPL